MGAEISIQHGYVVAEAPELRGASIWLDFPSVGATENIMTAAVLAKGTTVIDNAAREPEIVDLCRMLVAMGAGIDGIGTSTLEITGVEGLHRHDARRRARPHRRRHLGHGRGGHPGRHHRARRRGRPPAHRAGQGARRPGARSRCWPTGSGSCSTTGRRSFDVVTLPYPGLATDLQPQAIAALSVADGTAMITENLFEARFMFCDEIARMGADVRTDGHHAVVRGRDRLSGAPVRATDIRAGVGLVIAGLVADGVTEVAEIHHIDRGYVRFEEQLRGLGADVERVESASFGG